MSRESTKATDRAKKIASMGIHEQRAYIAAEKRAETAGSVVRVPTISEMRNDLKEAGWAEEHPHVWKSIDGHCFRGPALAWHMMMKKPWPPNP